MLFFRTHSDFHSVYRISELLIAQHHNNIQDEEWQHIRTLLHRLKRDHFLMVKNEGGNIHEEKFGSTPDRVERYFEKKRFNDVYDLQTKTDDELKEIMRARVDNQNLPHSIYHKAKMELEFRHQSPVINNGIIAGGSVTAGGDITSNHSSHSTNDGGRKSWWKRPEVIIPIAIALISIPWWPLLLNSESTNVQSNSTLKGPLTINNLADVRVPNFATQNDEFVVLSDGEYTFVSELSSPDYEIPGYVSLLTSTSSYAYSDFNNDGMADVAATIQARGGGTGTFNYLTVFLNNDGLPEYTASYYLGDRISVESVTASGSDLFVDIITQGPDEPMCCGTTPKSLHLSVYGNYIYEK